MERFKQAGMLFRKTNDPRGKIYCMLGIGELNYLSSNKITAKNMFLESLELADSYGFKIERGYARRLLKALKNKEEFPISLP